MPQNSEARPIATRSYGKDNLLKPHKMIVSYESRRVLLTNDSGRADSYGSLFGEAKSLIRSTFSASQAVQGQKLPVEKWDELRTQKGLTLLYAFPIEADAFWSMLEINRGKVQDVKAVDAVKISTVDDRLYILDSTQNGCFAFKLGGALNDLNYLMSRLERSDAYTGVFLSRLDPRQYGRNVIVPTWTQTNSLAVLEAAREIQAAEDKIPESIAGFFDDEVSALSIIKNTEGTTIYTDRDDQVVRLYSNGLLEYTRYNVSDQEKSSTSIADAINISTAYINSHFGFPADTYLSEIIRPMQGNRYILRYKYRYEGIPFVLDSSMGTEAIEIEIAGTEVKRYKRLIRNITQIGEAKEIKSFVEILDILLNKKITASGSENIRSINDLYIAYFERSYQDRISYIPVWVADVTVEKAGSSMQQRMRYIINGETGVIMDK